MIWVIVYAIYFMVTTPGSLKERWIAGITPMSDQAKLSNVNNEMTVPLNNSEINGEEMVNLA